MRIISGTAKGRRLHTPPAKNSGIRPTADRAREALFNILGSGIVDSRVLDLCAGTGAFGCEALSRGASLVVFVDVSTSALKLIAENVRLVPDGPSRSLLIRHDLFRGIEPQSFQRAGRGPFDIIFADPPYLTPLTGAILTSLDKGTILAENSLVILEEQKRFTSPEGLSRLQKIDTRTYGDSIFSFYRLRNQDYRDIDIRIDS